MGGGGGGGAQHIVLLHTHQNLSNTPLCGLNSSLQSNANHMQSAQSNATPWVAFLLFHHTHSSSSKQVNFDLAHPWLIESLYQLLGMKATPLKAPTIQRLQLYCIGIVMRGTLSQKHYSPNTENSPEVSFAPSPEPTYVSHQMTQ